MRQNWDGKCLDWHTSNNNLYWGSCHTGSNQKFYFEFSGSYGKVKSPWDTSKCMDYNFNSGTLYMGGCHSGSNQLFYFEGTSAGSTPVSSGTAKHLKTPYDTSKCGDYHTSNNDFYMGGCHVGGNQYFYMSY